MAYQWDPTVTVAYSTPLDMRKRQPSLTWPSDRRAPGCGAISPAPFRRKAYKPIGATAPAHVPRSRPKSYLARLCATRRRR